MAAVRRRRTLLALVVLCALVLVGLAVWRLQAPSTDPQQDLGRAHMLFAETAQWAGVSRSGGYTQDGIEYCQGGGLLGDQAGGRATVEYTLDLQGQTPQSVAAKVADYWHDAGEALVGGPVTVDASRASAPGRYSVHMYGSGWNAYVEVPLRGPNTFVFSADGPCGRATGASIAPAVK